MIYTAYYEKKCICDKNSYGDVKKRELNFKIDKSIYFPKRNANFQDVRETGILFQESFANAI